MRYNWNHVTTKNQDYFEALVGEDTLCVFRIKSDRKPLWMGMIEKDGCPLLIFRKDAARQNDRPDANEQKSTGLLTFTDPEKMKHSVENCYETGMREAVG